MPEPADRPPLRDEIAQALYEWAVGHTTSGARFLAGGTDKPLRENSLARADAVLPVVEPAMLAIEVDATQRADELAARLEQALDQIATERRGRLAAEAAVRRVRAFFEDMRTWCSPYGVAADYAQRGLEALDAEQPKETP